jgi:hypothetical protein
VPSSRSADSVVATFIQPPVTMFIPRRPGKVARASEKFVPGTVESR